MNIPYAKKILIIIFLFYNLTVNDKVETYNYYDLINSTDITIKNKSILIFEPNEYHYECTPGYAKYFNDLGFNVDLLIHKIGKNSFYFYEQKDKIRMFLYDTLSQINLQTHNFSILMNKYDFIVIQTINKKTNGTIYDLGLLNNNKSIFIFHYTYYYHILNYSKIENQNRIWTLGNFYVGLRVVPFYIGNFKIRNKNKKTRFFVISSYGRNYRFLVSASEKIKEEKLDFEIIVIGQGKNLTINDINNETRQNYIFKYHVDFPILYKEVYNSDYIIITLDPDIDKTYKNKKVTGSAQLSYGFLKPALINEYYKNIYNMTPENSFIYNKTNFYNVMKDAINQNNQKYQIMQKNLFKVTSLIKQKSLINIRKAFHNILMNV